MSDSFRDSMRVDESRKIAMELIHNNQSFRCPTCCRMANVRNSSINTVMAKWLIWVVHSSETATDGWVYSPAGSNKFTSRGGEHGSLKHWGLVERRTKGKDSTTKKAGFWRPTERGIAFVRREIKVPRVTWTYYNQLLAVSDGEYVDIVDALGNEFNYKELTRWMPIPFSGDVRRYNPLLDEFSADSDDDDEFFD